MLHVGWMRHSFNVCGRMLCGKVSFYLSHLETMEIMVCLRVHQNCWMINFS